MTLTCAKRPCGSCPYRKDVASGVWAPEEYAKLSEYDGDVPDQLMQGGHGLFLCHQNDGNLCAGWIACHGAGNLLAMRLTKQEVDPKVWAYKTDVAVFATGAEAAMHGLLDIEKPGLKARKTMKGLIKKRGRK